jgi:SAM-dependent methyltransferase
VRSSYERPNSELAELQNPWLATRRADGDSYDAAYERREAAGENVHGEADFLGRYELKSVLDAGCGTGRVARELARRSIDVAGVDLDDAMLATARRKAPHLEWHTADLATVDLGRTFDAVVAAGNVMIFLTPGTEAQVLSNLARHLRQGGILVAGFQLRPGGPTVQRYDALASAVGLELAERYATWERGEWAVGGDYVVSVHRRAQGRMRAAVAAHGRSVGLNVNEARISARIPRLRSREG